MTGVLIPKDLNAAELVKFFEDLFADKLKGAKIEIVTAVGSFLSTPNLMPETTLTSLNLQAILRTCQTVFLRPSVKLVEVSDTKNALCTERIVSWSSCLQPCRLRRT